MTEMLISTEAFSRNEEIQTLQNELEFLKKSYYSITSEKLSPIRAAFRAIRFSGLIIEKETQWALSLTIYHILMISYGGIAVGIELYLVEDNLSEFVEVFSTLLLYVNDISKSFNILIHMQEIKQLFNRLDEFSLEISQEEQVKNLNEEEMRPKSFRVQFISMFIVIMLWLPAISLITGIISDYLTDFVKPHLPYQLWIPWSMNGILPYLAGMIFVALLELTTCIFYTSFTIMFLTFTNELSACLKILQARLETTGPADPNIYKHHTVIIQLLQEYNNIFSGPLYIEILISTLQPCGFLYAFIKVFKNYNPAALELIVKALLCVAAPYIVCSCGQEISSQMEQLHRSAYACKWYEERPKVRQDLLTLMIVTTKRIDLNYRKFISYNYVCLASVFQGIYSYSTMIINLEGN